MTGVPTQELPTENDAFGTETVIVSIEKTVQLPEVIVCVIIYWPVTVTVSSGFAMFGLLNEAITGGTGLLPGNDPTVQLYELMIAGKTTVDRSVSLTTPQLSFARNLEATVTSTTVSLQQP